MSRLPAATLSIFVLLLGSVSSSRLAAADNRQAAPGDSGGLERLDSLRPSEIASGSSAMTGVSRPAVRILVAGDVPAGETGAVTTLTSPFTDRLGNVGFVGDLDVADANERFVWSAGAIVWHNSEGAPAILAGGESTMGIGDTGEFIYSPSVDGEDAVWSDNGAVLVAGDPAPGFPPAVTNTFNSRPTMSSNGRAYWVAGFNDAGGTTTLGRVLYTSATAAAGDIQVVLRSDDSIGGFSVARPAGIGFDYDFSEDGLRRILTLVLATGSTATDDVVVVDSAIVAREGSPTGDGDNWAGLDSVSINGAGEYLFSGDTSGATTTDEFIAFDGDIVLREGDVVDGSTLASPATVQALSIDEGGSAVYLWSVAGGTEILFFACDASDLAGATVVLATGDTLDFGTPPTAEVLDFNASSAVGPGLSLSTAGPIHVELDIDEGAGSVEAIVALPRPSCMPFVDGFESGNALRWSLAIP